MNNPFEQLLEKLERIEKLIEDMAAERAAAIPAAEDDLIDVKEACRVLKLAKTTLYTLTAQSKLPVLKKGKRLYFSKKELLEWVHSGRRPTDAELAMEASHHIQTRKARRY